MNALRALSRSVERSLTQGMIDGTGELAMRGYAGLHAKIAEMLPDDFYVTESLKLESKDGDDRKLLAQVQMATNQLVIYLEGMLRESGEGGRRGWHGAPWEQFIPQPPPAPGAPPIPPNPPNPPDWRGLGRELQEQIMGLTRSTLRRAFANIDWDVTPIRGADMQGEDLTGRDFRHGRLVSANLAGVIASGVTFEEAGLVNVNLTDAALTDTNFRGARLENCKLVNANLENADLEGAVFVNCDFSKANMKGARLDRARFVNPTFTDAVMPDGSAFEDNLRKFGAVIVYRKVEINKGDHKFKIEIDFDNDEDDEKSKPDDDMV